MPKENRMALSKKEKAELFSIGKFDAVLNDLNPEIIWNIVGEKILKGKDAVEQHCEQTVAYFKSVQTTFTTSDVLVSHNKVVVIGTAEFSREGSRLSFISACDVYEFNDESKIVNISSYCIPDTQ